jgi:hypothetical protein
MLHSASVSFLNLGLYLDTLALYIKSCDRDVPGPSGFEHPHLNTRNVHYLYRHTIIRHNTPADLLQHLLYADVVLCIQLQVVLEVNLIEVGLGRVKEAAMHTANIIVSEVETSGRKSYV